MRRVSMGQFKQAIHTDPTYLPRQEQARPVLSRSRAFSPCLVEIPPLGQACLL